MNITQELIPKSWEEFKGVRFENHTKHAIKITVIADVFQQPTIKIFSEQVKGEL